MLWFNLPIGTLPFFEELRMKKDLMPHESDTRPLLIASEYRIKSILSGKKVGNGKK